MAMNVKAPPVRGFLRLPQVLAAIPISRSAWWAGVKSGKYPQAWKLSPRCTAWKLDDIEALVASLGGSGGVHA